MASQSKPGNAAFSLEDLVPQAVREIDQEQTDGPAVNELAQHLMRPMLAFMKEKGWALDDPERVASEALTVVLASLDKYDRAKGTLIAWVWGVARNHLRSILRDTARKRHAGETPTVYEAEHANHYHFTSPAVEQRANLLTALLSLSDEDYQLLFLLFSEKKDATEVAALLKLNPAVVRQRKRRLVARLEASQRSFMEPEKLPVSK